MVKNSMLNLENWIFGTPGSVLKEENRLVSVTSGEPCMLGEKFLCSYTDTGPQTQRCHKTVKKIIVNTY